MGIARKVGTAIKLLRSVLSPTAPSGCNGVVKVGLEDMPLAWLHHLTTSFLDSKDRLALAQACHTTLEHVCLHHRVRVEITESSRRTAHRSVYLACKSSSHVELVIEGYHVNPKRILSKAAAQLGRPLTAVLAVTLMEGGARGLLTPWLERLCPNMTALTLLSADLTYTSLPFPQLQHLAIRAAYLTKFTNPSGAYLALQAQIQALPALTSLSVQTSTIDAPYDIVEFGLGRYAPAIPQLTHLEMPCMPSRNLLYQLDQLPYWFDNLQSLHLPGYTVDDESLEELMCIPTLRQLQCCNLALTRPHMAQPCPWTELSVEALHVPSFARLDLHHLTTLRAVVRPDGPHGEIVVVHSRDMQEVERFAAVVDQCGGIQWGEGVVGMMLSAEDAGSPVANASCMTALMPLLSSCHASTLTFSGQVLTEEVLSRLAPHLPGMLQRVLFDGCLFAEGAGRVLLASLPQQVEMMSFRLNRGRLNGQEVVDMCVEAHKNVRVCVDAGNGRFWLQWARQTEDVMEKHGCKKNVQLVVELYAM